jgi:excisionase family DNA binding protein
MPELLTLKEASARLRVPVGTLRKWRSQGRGPKSVKLGRHVLYDEEDLDRWVLEQKGDAE